jgi:hypothetical protein
MSYARLFFGKEINEITYGDVENFFTDEKEESDKIEFKSYYSVYENHFSQKESGIIRAVCGMLNSEGGLIIWGAPKGQSVAGKKEKIYKGELSPLDALIEKDAFISRVTNLVTPSAKGIIFQRLEKNSRYVYLIEVQQSQYAPHQYNNTYYMRIDGQTRPAPHHYIEALFQRISYPNLEGKLLLDSVSSQLDLLYQTLRIKIDISNRSMFQNEHDIYIKLLSERVLIESNDFNAFVRQTRDKTGSEMEIYNVRSTLYHLAPLRNYFTVSFDKDIKKGSLILIFGGKTSPLKMCKYNLRISSAANKPAVLEPEFENVYLFELNRLNKIAAG